MTICGEYRKNLMAEIATLERAILVRREMIATMDELTPVTDLKEGSDQELLYMQTATAREAVLGVLRNISSHRATTTEIVNILTDRNSHTVRGALYALRGDGLVRTLGKSRPQTWELVP